MSEVVQGRFETGGQTVGELLATLLSNGAALKIATAEVLIGQLSAKTAPRTPEFKELGDAAIEWAIAYRNLQGALNTAGPESLAAALSDRDGAALCAILERVSPQASWAALAEAKLEAVRQRIAGPPPAPRPDDAA